MLKKRLSNYLLYLATITSLLTLSGCDSSLTGILNPKGIIAFQERQLLFDASALMLIVVIPVIIMSFAFVWRYHHSHDTSEYRPNWSHNRMLESIWWGIPIAIIFILAIMTWEMSHKLDPYQKIDVPGKPIQVNAVALPWKWIFFYPEEGITTINYLQIPRGRQVQFYLTTDNVPMSSFFIPQLGSQIYTMAGMRTQLHLVATHLGTYKGLNSQYNGQGFAGMSFNTVVVSQDEYSKWVQATKTSAKPFSEDVYKQVRKPTVSEPAQLYSGSVPGLFNKIIESYNASNHPQ